MSRSVLYVGPNAGTVVHRARALADRTEFGAEVGFVGAFEEERAEMMLGLAVTVRGPG